MRKTDRIMQSLLKDSRTLVKTAAGDQPSQKRTIARCLMTMKLKNVAPQVTQHGTNSTTIQSEGEV